MGACYSAGEVKSRSIEFALLILLAGTVSASHLDTPPSPEAPVAVQQAADARQYLAPRLALWQKRLQLDDWSITLLQVKSSDLKPNTLGNIRWNEDDKTATIRVLLPSEYKLPYDAALEDMEVTVVHELIHLELASLPRSEASRSQEEHAVNRMAEALLDLEYRRQ